MSSSKLMKKLTSLALVTSGAAVFFGSINVAKGNERFYNDILMPMVQIFPPEMSHNLAVLACKYKIFPSPQLKDPDTLKTNFFGNKLSNPVGIAAGFDKQGEAIEGLHKIGFGFVEIGSVTPLPQSGNEKPRVFRLPLDKAVINRYGFNSDGHDEVFERLKEFRKNREKSKVVLGINLGKNKTSEDPFRDYVEGVKLFGPIADYLVINVSSPNTPGLRDLQGKKDLEFLLSAAVDARNKLAVNSTVPIFLKLAPDLTANDIKDIVSVVKQKTCKIDGLIISNTTVDKSNLQTVALSNEAGGLSGAPLKERSTKLIAQLYYETNGKIPIIGVGGVFSGQDAYDKILAGASFVQLYTALVYHGPPVISKIKAELDELLQKDGYSNVTDAIGKKYKSFL